MSVIGGYGTGSSASATQYSTIDELLSQLPNNTANLIDAVNVRNSVYTLWERISSVETTASQSASASVFYTNSTPVPITVGGISAGTTFSNKSMTQMWNALLYPYIAPAASLSGGSSREFGSPNAVSLYWSVTKNSDPITSIVVDGVPYVPTGNNQSGGPQSAFATQNTNTTFSMSVSDGTSTINAYTYVYWYNAVYWGTTPTFAVPSMSLTYAPYTPLSPAPKPQWANGASVGSGKNLASGLSGNYSGINGGGNYLVFMWPTAFGNPSFTINGLPNTAFTKLGSSLNYTNAYGWTIPYDVWLSNTAQNSAIASFIIS